MKHFLSAISVPVLLAAGLSATLPAQQASDAGSTRIEPEAMEALQRMGAYLRSLKAFQVQTEGTSEYVLTDGQKVQLAQTTNLLARFPDRLLAEINGDRGSKVYLYDGKSFTLFERDAGYYATVAAPHTLLQLTNFLQDKYNMEVPLVDLFLWGHASTPPPKVTSAMVLGPSQIGGVSCEHYAFRQEGLDWQVWIQSGDYPLPRKLVLTTTTDAARPEHTSVLNWNLAPSYNEAAFVFDPPPGVHRIVFAANAAGGGRLGG